MIIAILALYGLLAFCVLVGGGVWLIAHKREVDLRSRELAIKEKQAELLLDQARHEWWDKQVRKELT